MGGVIILLWIMYRFYEMCMRFTLSTMAGRACGRRVKGVDVDQSGGGGGG